MISPLLQEHFAYALQAVNSSLPIKYVLSMRGRVSSRHSRWIINETPKFYLLLRGGMNISYPGGRLNLARHEACVISPHIPHREKNIADTKGFAALVVNFRNNRMQAIAPGCAEYAREHGIADREYLHNAFRPAALELLRLLVNPQCQRGRTEEAAILQAFIGITRQAHLQQEACGKEYPQLMQRALQLIREQISDSAFNVHALAHALDCTPEHLSRSFTRHFGQCIKSYLTQQRLELAESILLTQSQLQIAEVAYMAGFASVGYFCTSFRQYRKISPRQYRQLNTQAHEK